MARSVIALMAAVASIAVIGAGPLAASPGLEASTEEIAGQQIARLLLIDTLEADEDRWDVERLEGFVERLEVDRTDALDIEVVEDHAGPALAVTIDAMGDDLDEVCIIADEDDQPEPAGRPCDVP